MAKEKYRWTFYRSGGVDQVVLNNGEDIAHLEELDQKLWLALSCPTRGLEFDTRTLDLIDTDHDGHIRPAEILAAVGFARDAFAKLDDLFTAEARVPLSAIRKDTEVGKQLLAEAKHILEFLGRPQADAIAIEDIADTAKILAATRFNGDGVLPAESAGDDVKAQAIRDILATMGGKPDRSGKDGVDQTVVDKFFTEAAAYVAWLDEGDKNGASKVAGADTPAAAAALEGLRAKVDDYFARCRLAAFDSRAAGALNPAEAALVALAPKILAADTEEIAQLPLASVAANRSLALGDGTNPAWASRLTTFAEKVVTPVLGGGKGALTEADWNAIKQRMAPYFAWQAAKPATTVATLPPARLRELLGGTMQKDLTALIGEDVAGGDQSQRVAQVERAILFRRDLVALLRNYVNFSEFYGRRKAIFQAGRLFIDARSCDLCLPVEDAPKHSGLAGMARAYLLYCDCIRKGGGEKRSIVAAVTGGETDNLMVGRNGVFCDRQGNDWDATVTKIVENPISIRQAFWSPYKRFVRMVEEQVAKRAAAADEEAKKKAEAAAAKTAQADKVAVDDKKPEAKKIDVGTVAAIGVAVAGLATFLTMFLGLGRWLPVAVLGLLLAISGPSMLIAWLKLRQRNVGPILDANGWAVNAMAKINIPFGTALTQVAVLPRGAKREMRDPFAEKKTPWGLYLFLLLLVGVTVLWYVGYLDPRLPEWLQKRTLLGG